MINIANLSKGAVIAALYNTARPQGMGFLHYDPRPMSEAEGQKLFDAGHTSFDYLKGRVMKVSVDDDTFDPWLFDRDNGMGAAESAIAALRVTGESNSATMAAIHAEGVANAKDELREMLQRSEPAKR